MRCECCIWNNIRSCGVAYCILPHCIYEKDDKPVAKDFSRSFYLSRKWKRCREAYRQSKFELCERCGQPGDEVHHKIYLTPENINNPDVTLSWDNLELLCHDCHTKEHHKKYDATRDDVMFDEHGDLVKRK